MPGGRRVFSGAVSGEFTLWSGSSFAFESVLQVTGLILFDILWQRAVFAPCVLCPLPSPWMHSWMYNV